MKQNKMSIEIALLIAHLVKFGYEQIKHEPAEEMTTEAIIVNGRVSISFDEDGYNVCRMVGGNLYFRACGRDMNKVLEAMKPKIGEQVAYKLSLERPAIFTGTVIAHAISKMDKEFTIKGSDGKQYYANSEFLYACN